MDMTFSDNWVLLSKIMCGSRRNTRSCANHVLFLSIVIFAVISSLLSSTNAMLTGSVAKCENEGQEVKLPLISDNPCITCTCTNKEVVCRRKPGDDCRRRFHTQHRIKAPKVDFSDIDETCYLYVNNKNACKECLWSNSTYKSGDEWVDYDDSCIVYTCQGGIVTSATMKCVQCSVDLKSDIRILSNFSVDAEDLKAPGQCCAPCANHCEVNGKTYYNGDTMTPESDPCVQCICQNGRMSCAQKACPALPCPENKQITFPGECCPRCIGVRKIFEIEDRCLMGMKLFRTGDKTELDKCTTCLCQDSTMQCERETCDCYNDTSERSLCCQEKCKHANKSTKAPKVKSCKVTASSNLSHQSGLVHITREDGDIWKPDLCTECRCNDGRVMCSTKKCRKRRCRPGYKLAKTAGKCCPRCIAEEGVCTVFGDPHYRTFDGKVFNFQGSCKYLLSQDCYNSSFTVKVRNDARSSKSFSWTKTVTIQIEGVKIALEQHMVVRVDHKRVRLPYIRLGVVSITADGTRDDLIVQASSGLKVLWDGDSFLEVTVPGKYRNRLCGLCGNFNGKKRDDMRMKKGKIASNSFSLGKSWRVGSRLKCSRRTTDFHPEPMCTNDWDVRIRAVKMCNAIKSSVFAACHKVISPVNYFKSCLVDMCECSKEKRCYCEALTAYARACSHAGVYIDWREKTNCKNLNCPKGAKYSLCGPGCKQTCRNFHFKRVCARQCVAGCQCPTGMVLHKDKCIQPTSCPVRKRPYRERGQRKRKRNKHRKTAHRIRLS